MDTSLVVAWLVGEGLITYKSVSQKKHAPLPADVLGVSGLFVLLGLLGEFQPGMAALLAWGLDIAAFMTLKTTGATTPAPATK